MKLAIITNNIKSKTSRILGETAKNLGIDPVILSHKDMSILIGAAPNRPAIIGGIEDGTQEISINKNKKKINLKEFSGFINRGIGTQKIFKIYYRLGIFSAIETIYGKGTLINSRECMELSTNKMLTSIILNKNGIPTPKTVLCENKNAALSNLKEFDSQIIVKPLFGSKGKGIFKIENLEYAEHLFGAMERFDEPFYLQEYLETSCDNIGENTAIKKGNRRCDIRLFVIDGRVIASMKRVSSADAWKTNIAKGGKAHAYEPTEEQKELAIKSSEAVKGEIIGVDLIKSGGKDYIIEVNAVPGFLGLQKVSSINIAEEILKYCKNKLKK